MQNLNPFNRFEDLKLFAKKISMSSNSETKSDNPSKNGPMPENVT